MEIIRTVVSGVVKQLGTMLKLTAEFFYHCVANGQHNRLSVICEDKAHRTTYELLHPLYHINLALVEGIVVGF